MSRAARAARWALCFISGLLLVSRLEFCASEASLNTASIYVLHSAEAGSGVQSGPSLDRVHAALVRSLAWNQANTRAIKALGRCLIGKGRLREGADLLHRVSASESEDEVTYYELGRVLLELGDSAHALEVWRNTNVWNRYMFLAQRAESEGELCRAAADYSWASLLRPEAVSAHDSLGRVLLLVQKQGPTLHDCWRDSLVDEAMAAYAKALSVDRGNVEALLGLGEIQLSYKKDGLTAMAYYRQALKTSPQNPWVYYGLGRALQTLGQWGDAVEAYENADAADRYSGRRHASILRNLAYAYDHIGSTQEALRTIEDALTLQPDDAMDNLTAAEYAFRIGNNERAEYYLSLACRLHADAVRVLALCGKLNPDGCQNCK